MNKDNIDNINIIWHNLLETGELEELLENKAAIYIYMYSNKNVKRYYVGSSINLLNRINQHKQSVNKLKTKNDCPIFYNTVRKYGWKSFKIGVLEYINTLNYNKFKENRKIILEKEQYYLDKINPSLNVLKYADSPLGVKRDEQFSINLSKARRGKSIIQPKVQIRPVRPDMPLKLSYRCKGVNVKVYDNNKNLIKEFPTITSAAKYLGVSHWIMWKILNTGVSYDNYTYEFDIKKENPILIINCQDNTSKEYYSIRAAAKDINTSQWSISKYINKDKLLKNVFLITRK